MQRILRHVVLADFEMEMRAGDSSRAANLGDHFTALDRLSLAPQIDLIMSVDRHHASAVTDNHDIAVATQLIAIDHFASFDGVDRRAFRSSNVDAVMKTLAA